MDWDDPVNDKVGNILLSRIMSADVRLDESGFDIGIRQSWEEAVEERADSRDHAPSPARVPRPSAHAGRRAHP